MTVDIILQYCAPIIVWLIAQVAQLIKGKISGIIIVTVIVPLVSLAVAWVTTLVGGSNFWLTFAIGFLAIALNELKSQLSQTLNK